VENGTIIQRRPEIEVSFCLSFVHGRSYRSSKFSNQLQATLSKCPGFRLNVRCCFFVSLVIVSLSVLFVFIVRSLVGALGLDVTGLLALIASSLGGSLGGAIAGEMSDFAAVVALLALGAVARHVSVTTARVASLSTTSSTVATSTTSISALVSAECTVSTGLWAVTSDVSDL